MIFRGISFYLIIIALITKIVSVVSQLKKSEPYYGPRNNVFQKSNEIFTATLYNIESAENDNFLVSPLSLNYCLMTLQLGAGGNTLKQLRTALNQPSNKFEILSAYAYYTLSLKDDKSLNIATKIYADKKVSVKEKFTYNLGLLFDAGIENLDFKNNPEQSRETINKFVANKTKNLIPTLFDKGAISSNAELVLVNAVYFKSVWEYEFDIENTKKKPFHGFSKNYEVDMMDLNGEYLRYGEDNDAQLLELPYTSNYSFFIILPKGQQQMKNVENKIKSLANNPNASPFADIFQSIEGAAVHVSLPKFKFEQTHLLTEVLEKLGVKDMFSGDANFEYLTDRHVSVSNVVQKTFISVNEKGTEAGAATGAILGLRSGNRSPEPPKEFIVDHPFIYIIMDKSFRNPAFVGRFNHP